MAEYALFQFESASKLKNEGNDLFKQRKYILAIEKYNEAINICPEKFVSEMAIFYQNRAACFEQLKEWQKVIDDCTQAILFNNKYEKALKRRCRAHQQLGKLSDALNDSAIACLINGSPENISDYNSNLNKLSSIRGRELYLSRGKVSVPDHIICSHFDMFPDNGIIEGEVNNLVLRVEIRRLKCSLTDDNSAKINALKGTMRFLKLNYSKAEEYFNAVIENDCSNELKIYSYIMLALCSFHSMLVGIANENVIPKVMKHFENALNIDPNNGNVYFHQTPFIDYLNRRSYDRTIEHLTKCVQLSPKNITAKAQLLYYRSLKTLGTKDKSEMNDIVNCFRKYLKEYPNSTNMIYYYLASLADTYSETGMIRECVEYALKCENNEKNFLIHKAFVYQFVCNGLNDINEVIRLYKEAVKADEKCQFGHEMLAGHYSVMFKINDAIKHLDMALKVARTEKEFVNLVRYKELLKSEMFALRDVNDMKSMTDFISIVHALKKQSHDEIICNWCIQHVYNGVPINCFRSKTS